MKEIKSRPSYYIYIFSIISLLILALLYGSNSYLSKKMLINIFDSSRNEFFNKITSFQEFEIKAKRYISSISSNNLFLHTLSNPREKDIHSNHLFLTLAKTAPEIMQLRFIGAEGIEKIRIDRSKINEEPFIVSKEKLQNKSNRDYFLKTSKLKHGEFWTSKLNLNIEYGKVEVPYKPTLRVSTPLYDGNKFLGIIIVNLFMEEELEKISDSEIYNIYIVDNKGVFLIHPDDSKNYGAYLNNPYLLKSEFPDMNIDNICLNNIDESLLARTLIKNSNETLNLIITPKESVLSHSKKSAWQWSLMTSIIFSLITFPLLYIFVSRNIKRINTHLSRQNNQFKSILEQTNEAIFQCDSSGDITLTNKSASRIFSLDKSEILNKNIVEFIIPSNQFTTSSSLFNNINTSINTAGKRSDGEIFPINLFLQKTTNDTYLLFIRDLTGEQENEQIIIQQSKRVSMGDMLAAIAHQWRQPLTTLGFVIQYFEAAHKHGVCDEELIKETVLNANQLIYFMSNTIDEFKDFTSSSSEFKTFQLEGVVQFVIKMLEPELPKSGVYLEFKNNINKKDGTYLYGSASELQQVLINLVHNAQDASKDILSSDKEHKPRITMSMDISTDNNVKLQVSDNNGGIKPDIIDDIFNPFFTTKGKNGTGLGLYICKLIIENRFKGSIDVKNVENGAVFTILIPIKHIN